MGKRDRGFETVSVYKYVCVCVRRALMGGREGKRMGYTRREEKTPDRTIVRTREKDTKSSRVR